MANSGDSKTYNAYGLGILSQKIVRTVYDICHKVFKLTSEWKYPLLQLRIKVIVGLSKHLDISSKTQID